MARKRRNRIFQFGPLGMDTNLLVVLFFIMVFGFIMIYSASYYKAGMSSAFNNDSMYFLKRQVVFSMVGVLVMLVVAGVNYHWICRFAGVGYLACFGSWRCCSRHWQLRQMRRPGGYSWGQYRYRWQSLSKY